MEHIGMKIKEYRKRKGLTQEELAKRLNVTYQAVSKWETGVSFPDLLQLVPIAKLFGVTTDELLGYTNEISSERAELENAYREACRCGDTEKRYHIAREAVIEYPEIPEYIEWLASSEFSLAFEAYRSREFDTVEYLDALMEDSMRRYEYLIDNCADPQFFRRAVLGKIMWLQFLGRDVEADWSAAFEYPDEDILTAHDALMLCENGRVLVEYLKVENGSSSL